MECLINNERYSESFLKAHPNIALLEKIYNKQATAEERATYMKNYASKGEKLLKLCIADDLTYEQKMSIRNYNENMQEGELEGFNCPICKNKGYIVGNTYGYQWQKECSCMEKRRTKENIALSEYEAYLTSKTFANFEILDKYHEYALNKVKEFLTQKKYPFLYVGGATGTGKSHLTVACYYQFLLQGKSGHFVKWESEFNTLRAEQFSEPVAFKKRLNKLKYSEVLLIDDFLWNSEGKEPTAFEYKIAKEILDERSLRNLITLMSSNYEVSKLFNLNPVVGGRITEFSGNVNNYAITLSGTNYRLKESPQLELVEGQLPF